MKIQKGGSGIGIEIFDGSLTKYGGHWQRLSDVFDLDYLILGFDWEWEFDYGTTFYDTNHNSLLFGPFSIAWGGPETFNKELDRE